MIPWMDVIQSMDSRCIKIFPKQREHFRVLGGQSYKIPIPSLAVHTAQLL